MKVEQMGAYCTQKGYTSSKKKSQRSSVRSTKHISLTSVARLLVLASFQVFGARSFRGGVLVRVDVSAASKCFRAQIWIGPLSLPSVRHQLEARPVESFRIRYAEPRCAAQVGGWLSGWEGSERFFFSCLTLPEHHSMFSLVFSVASVSVLYSQILVPLVLLVDPMRTLLRTRSYR